MRDVVSGLHELEQRSSHVTAEVHGEMQAMRAESERMMGGLFDENSGEWKLNRLYLDQSERADLLDHK
jgi:hypothetical protein